MNPRKACVAIAAGLLMFPHLPSEAAQPKPMALEGSRWDLVNIDSKFGDTKKVLVFHEHGKLEILDPDPHVAETEGNDHWELRGEKVILRVNDGYAIYEGEIQADQMIVGRATNAAGFKWEWRAYRTSAEAGRLIDSENAGRTEERPLTYSEPTPLSTEDPPPAPKTQIFKIRQINSAVDGPPSVAHESPDTPRSRKTARIEVNQSYEKILESKLNQNSYEVAKAFTLPFGEVAEVLLEIAGVDSVQSDAVAYDYHLLIEANGIPIGGDVVLTTSGRFAGIPYKYSSAFTGAVLSWRVSLKWKNIELYSKDFAGERTFPGRHVRFLDGPPFPDVSSVFGAFNSLFWHDSDSFLKTFGDMLASVFDLDLVVIYIDALESSDPKIQFKAAQFLGEMKDPRAFQPLINCLKNDNHYYRVAAVMGLGVLGDSRAVEPLIFALKDEKENVRFRTAEALGKIGDPRAVEPLISSLEDDDKYVIIYAAEALGIIGDTRAVSYLIPLLKKRATRRTSLQSLKQLTGQDFDDKFKTWDKWWRDNQDQYLNRTEISVTEESTSNVQEKPSPKSEHFYENVNSIEIARVKGPKTQLKGGNLFHITPTEDRILEIVTETGIIPQHSVMPLSIKKLKELPENLRYTIVGILIVDERLQLFCNITGSPVGKMWPPNVDEKEDSYLIGKQYMGSGYINIFVIESSYINDIGKANISMDGILSNAIILSNIIRQPVRFIDE
ncbi:HEAT repeat domain-containing protein [bacterium]|nr:HEAT repeat domain-containing protein [bacterium]